MVNSWVGLQSILKVLSTQLFKGDSMKYIIAILATIGVLLATGCATTISTGSVATVSPTSKLGTDLQATAYNLDQAIAIGVLPTNDPAAVCVHAVLVQTGIENPSGVPVASFEAKKDGPVSAGSIAYIKLAQLKAAKLPVIPVDCYALIGKMQVDGLKAAAGVGLLLK